MKKNLCIVALVLSAVPAFSQLYLRGSFSYNLPANSQNLGSKSKQVYDPNTGITETSDEAVYGSFGSGISFQFGFGSSINGTIGYDLELGYLLGKQYSTSNSYEDDFYTETQDNDVKSSSFQIAPSFTLTAGTGSIQPYTRIGPVLAFTKLKYEDTQFDSYNNLKEVREYELTGGMSIGFKGVVGVTFNTESNLQFFTEINFVSMSYAPKDGEITAYTVNGDDALDSIPSSDRKIEFKDKIDSDDGANVQLREKYSMGSVGLQIGVKYVLK